MIKTPLSTVIGGAFWTPGATVIGGNTPTFDQYIRKLFSNNEVGFAYDPNDLTTLYQDAAGTIPVAAAGQPVGLMKDKSGRNNHAYQTVSASRPILRKDATTGANYLEFDGVDDRLTTNSFPSMGLATTLFAGSMANNTYTGALAARTAGGYVYQVKTQVTLQSTNNSVYVPISDNTVITAKYAASGTGAYLKVNNIIRSNQLTSDRGYNNTLPLIIGAYNTAGLAPLSGHIYALIGVSKEASDSECTAIEKEIAKLVGVSLNV